MEVSLLGRFARIGSHLTRSDWGNHQPVSHPAVGAEPHRAFAFAGPTGFLRFPVVVILAVANSGHYLVGRPK